VLGWASATVRALWGRALATGAIATAQPEGERHGSVVIRVLDHLFVRRGGVCCRRARRAGVIRA